MSSWNGRWNHWGALALANPWAFAASLVLGAILAFVYSYVPLHTVNNRKIERLEASVLAKELPPPRRRAQSQVQLRPVQSVGV